MAFRTPFHKIVGADIADQNEAQTPIEPDSPVELGHVKSQGKPRSSCFAGEIFDHGASDPPISIFGEEDDLRQPDLLSSPDHDEASRPPPIHLDYHLVRPGRYGGVVMLVRLELEPEEGGLVSLIPLDLMRLIGFFPAEGLQALLPSFDVEAEEEGLVLRADGMEVDAIDHGRRNGG